MTVLIEMELGFNLPLLEPRSSALFSSFKGLAFVPLFPVALLPLPLQLLLTRLVLDCGDGLARALKLPPAVVLVHQVRKLFRGRQQALQIPSCGFFQLLLRPGENVSFHLPLTTRSGERLLVIVVRE